MNREDKIARLQALLERVQTRAKQGRPPAHVATASVAAAQNAAKELGFDIAPVAMPTAEPFDVEETRPFAKFPTSPQAASPASAPEPSPPDQDIEISIGTEEVEIEFEGDDVGEGMLEIVGEGDEERAEASRGGAADALELELDAGPGQDATPAPSRAEPVEAKKEAKSSLEVDDAVPRGRLTPERPSIEMLGQTVDLPEGTKEDAALELDQKPARAPIKPRPTAEMEAVIPGSMAPGVYPPPETDTKPEIYSSEPLTKDWALPDELIPAKEPAPKPPEAEKLDAIDEAFELEAPEAKAPEVPAVPAEDEAEAITKKPTDLDLQELAAKDLEEAKRDQPVPAAMPQPVRVEVAGQVVEVPAMSAEEVAAFVGSLEAQAPATFVEALDACLALGEQ